jgi:hypothetical protein
MLASTLDRWTSDRTTEGRPAMQPIHAPYLAQDRIASLRRDADRQRLVRAHREDRDPAPQPQPWPRLFLDLAMRILIQPMRVELR